MVKAIIFDCFGVLIADALRPKANELAATNPQGAQVIFDTLKQFDHGMISHDDGMARIAEVLGMTTEEAIAMSQNGEVRNAALIEELPALHRDYRLGLLSNVRGRGWLDTRFLPGELDQLFDVVVPSGEVGMAKPEPGIYQLAAERLGVTVNECVFIDDLQPYCEAAVAVGMQAIQYRDNHQVMADLHTLLANN